MTPEEILRIAEAAQGDPARLALAGIDLQFPDFAGAERDALRTALEAAAIPHWFDENILPALLTEPLVGQAAALAARLRRLRVVEPFPARGPGAANVHEATRLALRARMKAEDPAAFADLSAKAASCFAREPAPHTRIEALFHRFAAEPEAAAEACAILYDDWYDGGRFEALLALGVALEELLTAGLNQGFVRGLTLHLLTSIRYYHQPFETSVRQSREALDEFKRVGDEWRIAHAQDYIGNALRDLGDYSGSLAAYQAALAIRERRVVKEPGNSARQRDLSVAHIKVGGILELEERLEEALTEYRASLSIRLQLAKKNPGDSHFQRDISVAYDNVGDALSGLGKTDEALAEYRASLAIREKLARLDTENIGWQRDLAIIHNQIAITLQQQGNLPGALTSFRKYYEISERLATRDPSHAGWQLDLARSCANMARVLLTMTGGDREEAARLISRGLARMDALAKMHPPTPTEQAQRTHLEDLQRNPPKPRPGPPA